MRWATAWSTASLNCRRPRRRCPERTTLSGPGAGSMSIRPITGRMLPDSLVSEAPMAAVPQASRGPASPVAPADPLQRFCADLLATVGPASAGPGDLFQGLREELVRALQEGARGVAAELRRELSGW